VSGGRRRLRGRTRRSTLQSKPFSEVTMRKAHGVHLVWSASARRHSPTNAVKAAARRKSASMHSAKLKARKAAKKYYKKQARRAQRRLNTHRWFDYGHYAISTVKDSRAL
jgi:hypothetical protein